MNFLFHRLLSVIPLLILINTFAQDKCGTVEFNRELRKQGILTESDADFESWLSELRVSRKMQPVSAPSTIRVVVHSIHNGEQVGTGSNISDEQILSQLRVLNEDFRRLNADASKTPKVYSARAAGMNVQFALADTDPKGSPTSGILRVKGNQPGYKRAEHAKVKAQSFWDTENYMNIWVCNLTDYYGFTQFPISTLKGLSYLGSDYSRLTDGIIISYNSFGSVNDGPFNLDPRYNKGRILTHETGHFFGLRHIWGDGENCSASDFVDDTPSQSKPTESCPTGVVIDCTLEGSMYQNYMDYTYDNCMNLFTAGQVERMQLVLQNSPRRKSLLVASGDLKVSAFPEVFSPNGDGINDFWIWENTLEYAGCRLIIYDRFGSVVLDVVGYDNSWSGRNKNNGQVEDEAYFYEVRCENQKTITGGVRIVR